MALRLSPLPEEQYHANCRNNCATTAEDNRPETHPTLLRGINLVRNIKNAPSPSKQVVEVPPQQHEKRIRNKCAGMAWIGLWIEEAAWPDWIPVE